jgi:hypothetical protein
MRSSVAGSLAFVPFLSLILSPSGAFSGFHIHINPPHISPPHIDPPHIPVPHITVGPVSITPVGIVPTAVIKPAENVVNRAVGAATSTVNTVANAGGAAVNAATAPQKNIIGILAGRETLTEAAKNTVASQGKAISAVGEAVSQTNANVSNLKVVAAESIAGDTGKTIMNIVDGPNRLQVEFAATSVIEAGQIVQGQPMDRIIASPLAAAIRAAELQFQPEALPIPADVKARLTGAYPADVLNDARWAVGSISISVPDVTNQARKIFAGVDNAVTVGNVTVFVKDPQGDFHWWAHELQHQVQYHNWGIDDFAFRYVTTCHAVETDAETKAQSVVPINGQVSLGC